MDLESIASLIQTIKKLRDPQNGCPWDLKQTHHSLLKYLIEEAYEFVYAVENKPEKMEEELGDVLLQVILHAQIASEKNHFTINSVAQKIDEKMKRRHPHIFEDNNIDRSLLTDEYLQVRWDQIKNKENKTPEKKEHHFSKESLIGPSLQAAYKIGKKTKQLNFDWPNPHQVIKKVEEEWRELQDEIPQEIPQNKQAIKEELGDLLFSIAQLARHLDLEPEECLREANEKFIKRFNKMATLIKDDQKQLTKLPSEKLEQYWQQVKKQHD